MSASVTVVPKISWAFNVIKLPGSPEILAHVCSSPALISLNNAAKKKNQKKNHDDENENKNQTIQKTNNSLNLSLQNLLPPFILLLFNDAVTTEGAPLT